MNLVFIFILTFLAYISLKLTFLRGAEKPWDGNVFIKNGEFYSLFL